MSVDLITWTGSMGFTPDHTKAGTKSSKSSGTEVENAHMETEADGQSRYFFNIA
ncbi:MULTISPECIES: hypothetical protein [Mesorhizobium]|uniref:hypothetical protein n=1 Tax=Mesorhizobium TaxID=68287 RepID=UPI0012EA1BD3|nr:MULTISPECIES: hypothetical protein [Mesorhizobium]QIA25338.1 hypothetical protein A9K68_028985 [Mesorhizobium sp. AA22]